MKRQAVFRWPPSGTTWVVIAILAVLAGLVTLLTWQRGAPEDPADVAGTAIATGEDPAAGEVLTADLYFPGNGGWLRAERREIPASAETVERISTVVEHLLAGPRDRGLQPPLPDSVTLRKIYLAEGGLAFVDLESAKGAPPPASGSLREMLTVYSLVNTVLLNFEELEQIVLLWNGRQLKTFAGHLDTMRPLAVNTGLILQAQ